MGVSNVRQMLKAAIRHEDGHDSIFDAVRETISREALDRERFEDVGHRPMRPLALKADPMPRHEARPLPSLKPQLHTMPDKVSDMPVGQADETKSTQKPKSMTHERKAGTKRLFIMGGVALAGGTFLFLHPLFGLALVVLLFSSSAASYVILGYDGFWQRAMQPLRAYVARHPDRAADVCASIDQFAVRLDAVLDRMPERMVAALYLPDISDLAAMAKQGQATTDLRIDPSAVRQAVLPQQGRAIVPLNLRDWADTSR